MQKVGRRHKPGQLTLTDQRDIPCPFHAQLTRLDGCPRSGDRSRQGEQPFLAAVCGMGKVWQEEQVVCSLPRGCAGSHLPAGAGARQLPLAVPGDDPLCPCNGHGPSPPHGCSAASQGPRATGRCMADPPMPMRARWGHVHGAGGGDRSRWCSTSEPGPLCQQRRSGTGSARHKLPFCVALWRFRDNKLLISSHPLLSVLCSNAPIINYKLQY